MIIWKWRETEVQISTLKFTSSIQDLPTEFNLSKLHFPHQQTEMLILSYYEDYMTCVNSPSSTWLVIGTQVFIESELISLFYEFIIVLLKFHLYSK